MCPSNFQWKKCFKNFENFIQTGIQLWEDESNVIKEGRVRVEADQTLESSPSLSLQHIFVNTAQEACKQLNNNKIKKKMEFGKEFLFLIKKKKRMTFLFVQMPQLVFN